MFEDYYFDDPALQDALAAAGYYTDPARAPAVMPSTVQAEPIMGIGSPAATAPYGSSGVDLSGLGSLYGMNFATDFGGGAMGGIYPDDPNTEYISAPLSNKGNATSKYAGNAFVVTADQPVRLVDLNTKTILFEGTGYDAARKATELGQNLSDTMGRKAQYDIQLADPSGAYTTVASEIKNKSTLGEIANVAGTVLPLAMMAIPGVNAALLGTKLAATTAGQIALGALTGAASSGLKGNNILKGAALGGLTAAGGALIPKIPAIGDLGDLARPIGTGIGATAGGLATGQNLKNSLLGGVASGALAYAAPSIQDAIKGIGQGPNLSTGSAPSATPSATPSGPAPIATVTANTGVSTPVSFGGGSSPQTKLAELERPATIVSGSGSPFAASFPIPASILSGASPSAAQPRPDQMSEEDQILVKARPSFTPTIGIGDPNSLLTDAELQEILVKARPAFTPPVNLNLPTTGIGDPTSLLTDAELQEILVKGRPAFTPPVNINLPTTGIGDPNSLLTDAELQEILVKARPAFTPPIGIGAPTNLLPDNFFDPVPEKTLLEKIKDAANLANAVSVLVPTIGGVLGGGGGGGGTLAPDTSGLNFTTNPLRPTTPGTGIGGIGGRYPYTPTTYGRAGGDQETEYMFFTRDPVTGAPVAPVTAPATAPAGPPGKKEGGEIDDDMVKHLVDYHKNGGHQGPGQVKGIGSGQEDKIPAYLSDGEYVWSAQDVSDLGDGSNREGVRRLDKMRQMVRSQAGRKDVKKIAKPQKGIDRMLKAVGGMA
jgi:hypothetical protein